MNALPFLDEHAEQVDAPPAAVWEALGAYLWAPGPDVFRQYGRLVGVEPLERAGEPLAVGSTLVGFRVAESDPRSRVALVGRHRFSRYALIFHLDDLGGRTRLRAETRAVFPGVLGEAYKTLVIRSRGHVLAVRRMLSAIARRSTAR